MNRIVKPKTKRGKRFLENRDPKVNENTKKAMFIKGGKTNQTVQSALKDFYMLKKPFSLMLAKKNIVRPFDDTTPLEYLSQKNDHSLFMFGCHSKKRPNNLIIGRMFDNHVLDMFEFAIENLVTMDKFKTDKIPYGTKPCLVFNGELFDTDPQYIRLKCLLTDFFRGEVPDNIRLQGLEHALHFTAVEGKIHFRSYRINMKKSSTNIPNVELEEMGPSMDLTIRRNKMSSDDLYNKSKKQPKEITGKPAKNVSYNAFGSKLGRIHMQSQDLSKLQTRKIKGLKRKGAENTENGHSETKRSKEENDEINDK